jgi:hypothetical protein
VGGRWVGPDARFVRRQPIYTLSLGGGARCRWGTASWNTIRLNRNGSRCNWVSNSVKFSPRGVKNGNPRQKSTTISVGHGKTRCGPTALGSSRWCPGCERNLFPHLGRHRNAERHQNIRAGECEEQGRRVTIDSARSSRIDSNREGPVSHVSPSCPIICASIDSSVCSDPLGWESIVI